MSALTRPHERALSLIFSELAAHASETSTVLIGTPGTLAARSNAEGTRFWVRRFSDAAGKHREEYLGKVDDSTATRRVDDLRAQIAAANAAITRVRMLARDGYAVVDKKAFFTLASLHNHGVFRAGAFLIGSHAMVPSSIRWVCAPSLTLPRTSTSRDVKRSPSARYRASSTCCARRAWSSSPCRSSAGGHRPHGSKSAARRISASTCLPAAGKYYAVVPVPELKAHATGLPYLAYLLGAPQIVPILSPHGIVATRVPTPERYAVHKLVVSQLRGAAHPKVDKDLHQAAVVIDALAERAPGAMEDAIAASPTSARRALSRGIKALRSHVPRTAEAAWESLQTAT